MARSALWDALKPIAARMPGVVREHEILRIAARIPSKEPEKSADLARREVLRWAQKRSGGHLPKTAWDIEDFEYFSGGRNSIGIRIIADATDIWAMRADDPDKNVPGRGWTTEVIVGLTKNQTPLFSARLLASTPEAELEIEPHTPGFVQQVAEICGLWSGSFRVSSEPWVIGSDDDADELVEMLIDPERKLPTFVLTVPEESEDRNQPLIDGDALARATLGIGHVVVLPASHAWTLTQQFGRLRSVFGGAARAYLPGFSADADPYAHRLFLADHIATADGVSQTRRWMQWLAANESVRRSNLGREVLTFASIKNASLEIRQNRLAEEGASDSEQLSAASDRINALQKQLNDQKVELDYFDLEHKNAEQRAEAAENQARAAVLRMQQLLFQLRELGNAPDTNLELPDSWSEFPNWCDEYLAGRVVLAPAARRTTRSPEFENGQLAARCLLWLANEYRERRLNGGAGDLQDESVEDGIRNARCGGDQFDLTWQGQRHTADWHIKNGGNTRDPKRCLRIYYFWDPASHQIVVAEMPTHRRTGAT